MTSTREQVVNIKVREVFHLHKGLRRAVCVACPEGLDQSVERIVFFDLVELGDIRPGDLVVLNRIRYIDLQQARSLSTLPKGNRPTALLIRSELEEIYFTGVSGPKCPVIIFSDMESPQLGKMLRAALQGGPSYRACIVQQFQEDLRNVDLQSLTPRGLMELAEDYLGLPTRLISADSPSSLEAILATDRETILKWLNDEKPQMEDHGTHLRLLTDGCEHFYFPIRNARSITAYLSVTGRQGGASISEADLLLVEALLPCLALILDEVARSERHVFKNKATFLHALLLGDIREEITKRQNADTFNLRYARPRLVVIVELEQPRYAAQVSEQMGGSASNGGAVQFSMELSAGTTLYLLELKELILSSNLLHDYLLEIHSAIQHGVSGAVRMSVSCVAPDLGSLDTAYTEAESTMRYGKIFAPEEKLYCYDMFILYHLLNNAINNRVVYQLYSETIKRLSIYDNEHETELLKTLETLVFSNYNIQKTSEVLFIHRNTLYKRIEKLTEILGMGFETSNNDFILQLAVRLYRLFN